MIRQSRIGKAVSYTFKDHWQEDPTIVYKQLNFALAIDLWLYQFGQWEVQNLMMLHSVKAEHHGKEQI